MRYTELNYNGFEEYLIREGVCLMLSGLQYEFEFPNGYGASVVKHNISYGNEDDLFELAVTDGGSLCYTTHITDDVIGWLNNEGVLRYLDEIKNLNREIEEA
jgi:hypothetical protein